MRGSRGGDRGPDPLGKSQVISISMEISIWTPLEKVGPPFGKCWNPTETLENYSFL